MCWKYFLPKNYAIKFYDSYVEAKVSFCNGLI